MKQDDAGSAQMRGSQARLTKEELDCVRAAIRLLEHSTNAAADRAREGLLSIYRRFAGDGHEVASSDSRLVHGTW